MVSETIFYNCELGILKVSATDKDVTEITFTDVIKDKHERPSPQLQVLATCVNEMDAYFNGTLKNFTFSFQQNGSEFQKKVWEELSGIPFGKTISYLDLSKKLGNTKAIRAAASANGKNSLAIVIPCHRVIGSNGSLVGYAGELWRKKWLLSHEARYQQGVQSLF